MNDLCTKAYSPKDIETILGIKKSQTYNFLQKVEKDGTPFKVIRIGQIIRVPKEPFDKWFEG